ncbi:hypothetical protein C8R47DRAFT_1083632 [Mycena vitilis]|nr:hypothetical protein C8R47DRAFT_1083632 [Mycena vitilis]
MRYGRGGRDTGEEGEIRARRARRRTRARADNGGRRQKSDVALRLFGPAHGPFPRSRAYPVLSATTFLAGASGTGEGAIRGSYHRPTEALCYKPEGCRVSTNTSLEEKKILHTRFWPHTTTASMTALPTLNLRSGHIARDLWAQPNPHTDLTNPGVYKPAKPLPSTSTLTTGFLATSFTTATDAKSIIQPLTGGTALSRSSQRAYAAQRTADDAQKHDNTESLDAYLTDMFCIPKRPPCKLARAAPSNHAPFIAVVGPSNDLTVVNGNGEDLDAVAGPSDDPSGEDLDGWDLDQGWRHPCWWCFTDVPDQLAYITRDKSDIERALKLGLCVSFRYQFGDIVSRVREILHFKPAHTAYLKSESKGGILCCCKDINAVGAYVEVLAGLA